MTITNVSQIYATGAAWTFSVEFTLAGRQFAVTVFTDDSDLKNLQDFNSMKPWDWNTEEVQPDFLSTDDQQAVYAAAREFAAKM